MSTVTGSAEAPVKMMADDKSYTMYWKNYKAGPQDASLFEVPKDFKVMGIPGSSGPAGTEKSGGVMLP